MAKSKNSVLLLSVMDFWGGGEEVLLKIALNVPDNDFYVVTPPGASAEKFLAHQLSVFSLASLKKIFRTKEGWTLSDKLNVLKNITKSVLPLYFFMKREKISLIVANGNFAALFALPLVLLFRKKLVIIQHLLYEKNSFEGKLLKFLVKYSDTFVCVSKSVAENILGFIGKDFAEKNLVIYNGISLQVEENMNPNIQVSQNEIIFAIVGSIIPEKGHDLIIEAFYELVSNFPQCMLYVFGEPREESSSKLFFHALEEKIERFDLSGKVFFNGYVEEKSDLYNQFDVLINYSVVPESFSMTVLEGLAHNKVVIASGEGGPSEIIQHEINGFLVEPRNKQALYQTMKNVISKFNNDSLTEIRKNGRLTVEKKFSLNRFTEEYKNLLATYTLEGKA